MDAIRTYVNGAFANIAPTPAAIDQQAELVANMEEKLRDLVQSGKTESEALGITLAEAGDLDELTSQFPTLSEMAARPATVEVRVAELRLLARLCGVGIALAVGLGFAGFMSATRGLGEAGLLLILCGIGAAAWVVYRALIDYSRLDVTETVEQLVNDAARSRKAWLRWGLVSAAAFVLTVLAGPDRDFWAWAVWAGAFAIPAEAMAASALVRLKVVTVERAPLPARDAQIPVVASTEELG